MQVKQAIVVAIVPNAPTIAGDRDTVCSGADSLKQWSLIVFEAAIIRVGQLVTFDEQRTKNVSPRSSRGIFLRPGFQRSSMQHGCQICFQA